MGKETDEKISSMFETPFAIPLISLLDIRSHAHRYLPVRAILIPFYEIWGHNAIHIRRWDIHDIIGFDGPVGLSSIGPDDYVMSEAYFIDFLRFALECNFDFAVAWDAPTYVDMPTDISWRNTIYGVEQLRRVIRAGISAVGLLNGSSADQYARCADLLISMGIDSVALHVSEYLRNRKDRLLIGLMWDALKIAMAKLLIKAGLVPGKKTRGQYFHHLPKQILDNPELSKYHMSATLTEESSPSLRFNVGSRPSISIAYTRSIDVTDTLTSEYIDSLEKEKKYYIGKIPDDVRSKIRLLPFPLLEDEINLLRGKFGIDVHTSLKSIYKSKQDRVTAEWGAVFSSAEAIKKFTDRIGFLPGSRVENRFEMILKLYEENKNKALSQEDVDRIGKELGQS